MPEVGTQINSNKMFFDSLRRFFPFLVGAGFILTLSSCYYDKEDVLYPCNTNQTKGPLFTRVDSLITSRCGSICHLNGARAGGYNFDDDCSIVSHWRDINKECQSNEMPPPPLPSFSTSEKAILSTWINAGHRYDN